MTDEQQIKILSQRLTVLEAEIQEQQRHIQRLEFALQKLIHDKNNKEK